MAEGHHSGLTIFIVPYDSGYRESRMGKGPAYILNQGLVEKIAAEGFDVQVQKIEAPGNFHPEVTTAFQLNRILARRVREVTQQGRFPVVLSGNCNCSIGVMSGLSSKEAGVIWFDAHGDFNTPETSVSGFLDGMALATLTGRCWKSLSATIEGFQPVIESRALLVGARDLDVEERNSIVASNLIWIDPAAMPDRFSLALSQLKTQTPEIHLHIDLDVLEPSLAPANQYVAPNGLTPEQLLDAVKQIAGSFAITSICIAAYDPEFDPDSKTARFANDLLVSACAERLRTAH